MPTVKARAKILGATIEGLDLSKPLTNENRALIPRSLGTMTVPATKSPCRLFFELIRAETIPTAPAFGTVAIVINRLGFA